MTYQTDHQKSIPARYPGAATRGRSILYKSVSLMLLSCLALNLHAAFLYRYTNDQGLTVLTQTLPAEYATKGYEIMNEKGRVLRVVDPELTPEQIAERDAALERERLAELEKARQDKIDEELKLQFTHPNDAVRVLNRRIQDFFSLIEVKKGKINNMHIQIKELQKTAADRQRKGLPITEDSLSKIDQLQKEIEHNEMDIIEINKDIDKLLSEFDEKIKRLEIITHKQATDYPEFLKTYQVLRQKL